jgi:diketogulonate reductase-like aldo/keto reductase
VAYSPLGTGAQRESEPVLLQDPAVVDTAASTQRTPAQIVLNWNLRRGVGVIPKASNPAHLKANFDVDFDIGDESATLLSNLKTSHRFIRQWEWGPFKAVPLWD